MISQLDGQGLLVWKRLERQVISSDGFWVVFVTAAETMSADLYDGVKIPVQRAVHARFWPQTDSHRRADKCCVLVGVIRVSGEHCRTSLCVCFLASFWVRFLKVQAVQVYCTSRGSSCPRKHIGETYSLTQSPALRATFEAPSGSCPLPLSLTCRHLQNKMYVLLSATQHPLYPGITHKLGTQSAEIIRCITGQDCDHATTCADVLGSREA